MPILEAPNLGLQHESKLRIQFLRLDYPLFLSHKRNWILPIPKTWLIFRGRSPRNCHWILLTDCDVFRIIKKKRGAAQLLFKHISLKALHPLHSLIRCRGFDKSIFMMNISSLVWYFTLGVVLCVGLRLLSSLMSKNTYCQRMSSSQLKVWGCY